MLQLVLRYTWGRSSKLGSTILVFVSIWVPPRTFSWGVGVLYFRALTTGGRLVRWWVLFTVFVNYTRGTVQGLILSTSPPTWIVLLARFALVSFKSVLRSFSEQVIFFSPNAESGRLSRDKTLSPLVSAGASLTGILLSEIVSLPLGWDIVFTYYGLDLHSNGDATIQLEAIFPPLEDSTYTGRRTFFEPPTRVWGTFYSSPT